MASLPGQLPLDASNAGSGTPWENDPAVDAAAVPWDGAVFASVPKRRPWLTFLSITLLGYALLSKGWAYVGIPPFAYIGECLMVLGMIAVMFKSRWTGILGIPTIFWLAALGIWGLARTVPFIETYGVEALRDAAIWGYAIFALVIYGYLLAEPSHLKTLIGWYDRFAGVFVLLVPPIWLLSRFFEGSIPRWPWADVPVIDAKGGDVLVHAAGILAFLAAGLAATRGGSRRPWRVLVLAACIGVVGMYNRGGLMTVVVVFTVCFVLRPYHPILWQLIITGLIGLLLLAASGWSAEIPGKGREVSFAQVLKNMGSIAGEADDANLDGTKEWRLNWWEDIFDYTVRGPYFWGGKGFGINLADDDGYQGTRWEGKLRSPHNGHLTMLARAGVPGIVLWLLVHITWAARVGGAYFRASRRGDRRWAGVFLFLGAYWLAFMTNATFDVFLEGPMGGVWFWTVFGVGLAAVQLYREQPGLLQELPTTPPPYEVR